MFYEISIRRMQIFLGFVTSLIINNMTFCKICEVGKVLPELPWCFLCILCKAQHYSCVVRFCVSNRGVSFRETDCEKSLIVAVLSVTAANTAITVSMKRGWECRSLWCQLRGCRAAVMDTFCVSLFGFFCYLRRTFSVFLSVFVLFLICVG